MNDTRSIMQPDIERLLAKISSKSQAGVHQFRLAPDGGWSMPFASPSIVDIYGVSPELLKQDFNLALDKIHPEDIDHVQSAIEKSRQTMQPFNAEWRINHPTKGLIWVACRSTPEVEPDGGISWYGHFFDISDLKSIEQEHKTHLHFFECMDQVNRAMQGTNDIEQMMEDVLDTILHIFSCDRAWLMFPCNPDAEFWVIPMERTSANYPGAFIRGEAIPMDTHVAENIRLARETDGVVCMGEGTDYPLIGEVFEDFTIRSIVAMAIYPKIGEPWMFGLHQCSHSRIWTQEEIRIFEEIGYRLTDGLTSLLVSRELKESETRFRQAFEYAGIGMAIISLDGHFQRVNQSFCDMLDYNEQDFYQLLHQDLIYPQDLETSQGDLYDILENKIAFTQQVIRLQHKQGHYIWTRLTISAVRSTGGEPLYFVAQIEDIDQQQRDQQLLQLMSFAINHVAEAVYLVNEDARFEYVNTQACEALGYSREELLELGVPDIDPDYQMDRWGTHWQDVKSRGSVTMETIHKTRSGKIYPVELNVNYFEYDGQRYNLAFERDITERKEQEAHIQYLAYHDALTGLPNRTLVLNRLEQAVAQAMRNNRMLAVLFIDLDRFKIINDTLGHPTGDALLQQAARLLNNILREGDTVGRVGGDEFLVLLPGVESVQDCAHVAGKIISTLSSPFTIAGHELRLTASIGISMLPRDAKEVEILVKYADAALYLAKEQGRNTFRFFSPELDEKVHNRLHMESDLRFAIERNELILYYQPRKNLSTGELIGVEALLRWNHPTSGLVPPDNFIPVAEETGLIIPIGEWVFHNACQQAHAWKQQGFENFQVSVNLSRRQLDFEDLADTMARILRETGCDPQLIELEITESSAMDEPEQAIVRLKALHDLGINIAIDDFGTGYSSLAYLKRFPFDRLKIDKSFIAGIPDDSDDVAIVQTTIVLAHQLRLNVIAEGVETEAQQKFLLHHGCVEMQGYLFGKPMRVEDLEKNCLFPAEALSD